MTTDITPESLPDDEARESLAQILMGCPVGDWGQSAEWERVVFYEQADAVLAAFSMKSAAHDAEVARAAIVAAADDLAGHYPQDVFLPLTHAHHEVVNAALKEHTGISRDRISADMMRRAAAITRAYAEQIGEEH